MKKEIEVFFGKYKLHKIEVFFGKHKRYKIEVLGIYTKCPKCKCLIGKVFWKEKEIKKVDNLLKGIK
jgi:hypothetical protein